MRVGKTNCYCQLIRSSVLFSGLQTDHKELMSQIEQGLYELHAQARQTSANSNTSNNDNSQSARDLSPFVLVDRVDLDSPSMMAVSNN